MRRIAVLDAPSNLGLRPPTATSVPGCAKAPGALRDQDLLLRLGARDAGCVTPPRYDPGDWRPGDGVCHAESIGWYSRRLADRIGEIVDAGEFPLILGGDCSILLGSALAVRRMSERDELPYGLVYVDGHSDFRHPGNASYVGAAAGEGLALVTGRGQPDLTNLEGLRPYIRDEHLVLLGIRAQDDYRLDLQAAGLSFRAVPQLRGEGAGRTAAWAREQLAECMGYWLHVDVDVLDPAVMPAVDAPDEGGIAFAELQLLIAGLVDTPDCLGMQLTVFDPDYDPEGDYAREVVATLVAALEPVRRREARAGRPLAMVMPTQRADPDPLPAPAAEPPADPAAADPVATGPPASRPPAGTRRPDGERSRATGWVALDQPGAGRPERAGTGWIGAERRPVAAPPDPDGAAVTVGPWATEPGSTLPSGGLRRRAPSPPAPTPAAPPQPDAPDADEAQDVDEADARDAD
jgi:arginase